MRRGRGRGVQWQKKSYAPFNRGSTSPQESSGSPVASGFGGKNTPIYSEQDWRSAASTETIVCDQSPDPPKFSSMATATAQSYGPPEQARSYHGDGFSKEGRSEIRQNPHERDDSHFVSGNSVSMPSSKPFDICPEKNGGPPKLKAPLHLKNKEIRNERNKSSERKLLRPGMVLLRNYLSNTDQIKITKICQEVGVGQGGFYKPGYNDGAKLHLQMMCLGKNWEPQTRVYNKFRSIDGAAAPVIPEEFKVLVEKAIKDSHALIKQEQKVDDAERILPRMQPDICIVNFYTETGKLGLHQDRDESEESLSQGLPVVSFSIGDSAEFLYGDSRDPDEAEKVVLESGDVLIFGGKARHVFHGVPSINQGTAPKFLNEETNLRPGRLNLTFRQY